MKISLKNFGIIKKFEFDIKNDFNLIFGHNNTGKSYAISAIYLILKNIISLDDAILFRFMFNNEENSLNSRFDKYLETLKSTESIEIKKDIEELISKMFNEMILRNIQESFKNTFDSIENLKNQLSPDDLEIDINTDLISFTIKLKDKKLYVSSLSIQKKSILIKKVKRNLSYKDKEDIVTLYYSKDEDSFKHQLIYFIIAIAMDLTDDLRKHIKNIYYLPASRSGLYQALSAFGQIIVELSKSRKFTTKKLELPSISEPLSDYFLELSNIKKRKKENSTNVLKIAYEIEKEILNGEVSFDNNTKKLIFKPNSTNLLLDLSYTSSMVSELSPIVSYLKYIVNYANEEINLNNYFLKKRKYDTAKYMIIIEEPEAHLHPDIQILLLSKFAELVKENVKFIITTHSNYMFNKFNNLILAKELNLDTTVSYLFKDSESGTDAIKQDLDEFGIEDENFINTSEELYNEKISIIDQMNKC